MYLNVNANENITFSFVNICCGNTFYNTPSGRRYTSPSGCVGSCNNFLYFANSSNPSAYVVSPSRFRFSFNVNDNVLFASYSFLTGETDIIVDNICDVDIAFTRRCFRLQAIANVFGYVGKSIIFGIRSYGSLDYDYFLLKGGIRSFEDNTKIDYFNHGDLLYLGNSPKNLGISMFTFDIDSNFNVTFHSEPYIVSDEKKFDKLSGDSVRYCGSFCNHNELIDFYVVDEKNDIVSKLQEISNNIKKISLVNEIIVDDNLNVNISKPNYHFYDSDNQGFWGR